MKDSVYQNSVADNKDVKKRVEALVYIDMLQSTLLELENGLGTARVINGLHFVYV